MMAELLGPLDGLLPRTGRLDTAWLKTGILGTNGIVGGGIPIATGAAYGLQTEGRDDVAVSSSERAPRRAGLQRGPEHSVASRLPPSCCAKTTCSSS